MIFVTLGSQKFQFDRLLKEIDRLIENNEINEEVFAQIGYSNYIPKNYSYKNFFDREEFNDTMSSCSKVITHGGTGAIIGALKRNKKVIAVPRLKKYGEHVDDHQLDILKQFEQLNLIKSTYDILHLAEAINNLDETKFNKYISNTDTIIKSIEEYIALLEG